MNARIFLVLFLIFTLLAGISKPSAVVSALSSGPMQEGGIYLPLVIRQSPSVVVQAPVADHTRTDLSLVTGYPRPGLPSVP